MWRGRGLHLPLRQPCCHRSVTCIKLWIMEWRKIIFSARQCWTTRNFRKLLSPARHQCWAVFAQHWQKKTHNRLTFPLKTTERPMSKERKPVWSVLAPTPHTHRALFGEIGIIKFTFELSSLSSARGITHNDIQWSPDHIYDSIFDTAVHQQRITQPKRITLPSLSLNTIHFPV